jgi:hypothetical protein
MTDGDFEAKLQALTGALRRTDPTPEWKADILERARAASVLRRMPRLPRWLLAGLAACWTASAALYCLTPVLPKSSATDSIAEAPPSPAVDAAPSAMLAFNRNLSLDLP